MAIRLRFIRPLHMVALCAAKCSAEPGDIYLDDAAHGALAHKFGGDWKMNGFTTPYEYDPDAPVESRT